MPVPRVAESSAVRKPIRPRDGTVNCRRTQPEPWLVKPSIRPPRSAIGWVTVPMYSSGIVDGGVFHRLVDPHAVDLLGDPPADGRRSARSLRAAHLLGKHGQRQLATALDFKASGRSGGSTLMDTLPMSSRSDGPLIMRAVSLWSLPSVPATGESLVPKVMEMAGSSTWMSGSGFGR